jgi:putative MATE family efflux protein
MIPVPTWRLVLMLALPVMAQSSIHLVISLSDSYLGGHYPLPDAERFRPAVQAAQTQAHYLSWAITSYLVIITVGGTALVARAIGAGDRALANDALHQSMILAMACAVLPAVFALVGGIEALVAFLRMKPDAAPLAIACLKPTFYLLVFLAIEQAGVACLVGAGDTRTGLWVMAVVAIINLPLAWMLSYNVLPLPPLGLVGISLGTALAHVLGAIAVVVLLVRGRHGLRLHFARLVPKWEILRRLLRISVPAALDSLSLVAGQLWFLSIVNQLGNVAGSAHGIALRWEALGYLSGGAFGVAATTIVGQNLGAGRPEHAARGGWIAFALGCGIMTFMGVVFYVFAPEMFRFLTDEPEIVTAGIPALRLIAFAMPSLAATIVFTSALRGAGDTRVPVLFTFVGFFVVRIPLAYYLTQEEVNLGPLGVVQGLDLGLIGAWLAMVTDLVIRGFFFLIRFIRGKWKLQVV